MLRGRYYTPDRGNDEKLPIIIISGNQGDVWQQQALDAGANEFLSKPVRPSALHQLLERYLGSTAGIG